MLNLFNKNPFFYLIVLNNIKKEVFIIAEVVHLINGRYYLYEHNRVGDKVITTYLRPVDYTAKEHLKKGKRSTDSDFLPDNFKRKTVTCVKCGEKRTVNDNSGNQKYYCLCGGEMK